MKKSDFAQIATDIAADGAEPLNRKLFDHYADTLRKAVDGVLGSDKYGDRYFDLQQKLQLNAARFAAAKAYQATQQVKELSASADADKQTKAALSRFNHWLNVERNAAIARARTAEQWTDFNEDPIRNELYPNLRWIPSRSVHQREEHIAFYNRVWAKTDPFWTQNQPGTLWNCKCDWEETDEPPTGEAPEVLPAKGLKGNPAITGEIFSQDASYFEAVKETPGAEKECNRIILKDNLSWAKENLKPVKRDELKTDIQFSTKGIKEYLNQPSDNYFLKNELIRSMDSILKKATYRGVTQWKGRKSHIFEITFMGKKNYIIANESRDGNVFLYSITNSNKVLTGIGKA
jgi:hypothetical protein